MAAGSLHRILGVFAARKIDLAKIESRPNPASPFEYRFYLDFAGGTGNVNVKQALRELETLTLDLRILGSYPKARLDMPPGLINKAATLRHAQRIARRANKP